MPASIKLLDQTVVNRIAAGEIIQRPANAIKEMLENSIDAGATQIQINVKQGGLKYIQIVDNGSGVNKEDMPIICERFTTSKLREFSDLQSISTYGFRGEALASISHVAHVTITTRTADAVCAFKAEYSDGRPKGVVKPCAGNKGTSIVVEDLFYNVPMRLSTLRNSREEFAKILDCLNKYAIHNAGVGISLRRLEDGSSSVTDLKTVHTASISDNICTVYGSDLGRELVPIEHTDSQLNYTIKGYVTNGNYNTKKMSLLLFINHRLVDCATLKKAVENVYSVILPKKTYPFVYLSVNLPAHNVDVNVHPTKHEVHFLHEESIVTSIQKQLEIALLNTNESRTFYTQSLLPSSSSNKTTAETSSASSSTHSSQSKSSQNHHSISTVKAQDMVRTDSKEQKIVAFFQPKAASSSSKSVDIDSEINNNNVTITSSSTTTTSKDKNSTAILVERRNIRLVSVLSVQNEFKSDCCPTFKGTFRNMSFVGCVDEELCLVQHETTLLLLNMRNLSEQFFYQRIFFEFGNLGEYKLSESVHLEEIALVALELPWSGWKPEDGDKNELAGYVSRILTSRAGMLWDYFSLKINPDTQRLISIPMLLDKYTPDMDALPLFILRLATEVIWDSEKECFQSVAKEISRFYAQRKPIFLANSADDPDNDDSKTRRSYQWTIEHVLLPALKSSFLPSKRCQADGNILQLASLPDLYKVFERC